jgi:hypothetical protein
VLPAGLPFRQALRVALAADTVNRALMSRDKSHAVVHALH